MMHAAVKVSYAKSYDKLAGFTMKDNASVIFKNKLDHLLNMVMPTMFSFEKF